MARRGQDFKMRLLDQEAEDLEARADRDGLAKADVIRKAMGWPLVNLVKASRGDGNGAAVPPPPPSSPSAGTKEPGATAAAELARRIKDRKAKS